MVNGKMILQRFVCCRKGFCTSGFVGLPSDNKKERKGTGDQGVDVNCLLEPILF